MLMVSESDTTVPTMVKTLLEKRLGPRLVKAVVLENSEHTLPTDCEKDRVTAEVLSWFE